MGSREAEPRTRAYEVLDGRDAAEGSGRTRTLRGNGDRLVYVAVEEWGAVQLIPELAHIEVVDGRGTAERLR
jgi:hypothetical protein